MIGYYVHHVGRGHLRRARALASVWDGPVTGLSTLPRPDDWRGDWVRLAADDSGRMVDSTAHGQLHWAPVGHPGHRDRMAAISAWIADAAPDALVVDVSMEVLQLARLHGVRTVGVVLPGHRGDVAHLRGLTLADALVGFWPDHIRTPVEGVPEDLAARIRPLGALSGLTGTDAAADARAVTVLLGAGGHGVGPADLAAAQAQTPEWSWTVLAPGIGDWVADPAPVLARAAVVVTHAGEGALADVATARRPAVVLPQERPHDEQWATARALTPAGLPVAVLGQWPDHGWAALLDRVAALPGADWKRWCDGEAATRFAALVREIC
ncbi:glycosyltransferase [Nocardioides massiliensis]|uniref:Glycosyl transferase family 28 C-terminal domain-containing protein n=1 Tax=Nocardioides massiliensis TaxID=1325935 RepID=A0ABT9NU67_9ACTN|nr:glycosyltransferase [Nocardioides massiliensis]MDP9823975.1 hypothetical protein [Nocardioides massiliensis]